jgi:hypothetical protein
VLNHVAQSDKVEGIFGKWVGILIQIMDNVDPLQREPIKPDTSRELFSSAADIQNLIAQVANPRTTINVPGGQF